jgi:hypothetical protein
VEGARDDLDLVSILADADVRARLVAGEHGCRWGSGRTGKSGGDATDRDERGNDAG